MINRSDDPVAWALFLDELADAREHLGTLLSEIQADADYDEPELRVDLGHVYSHLNRAWARWNMKRDLTEDEWEKASAFPDDLTPI